jgi:hypothetical protein
MKFARPRTTGNHGERGYALLLAVFLITVLLISTMSVAPNILTQGRREKEKDMIWRGKQYTRGVKLYYRKLGRFPTSLDDLTKPKVGTIRFMRQAYKDPMNKEDGTWRLIYVGAAGQLIGSLKPPQQNLQLPQTGAIGTPASALGGLGGSTQTGTGGFGQSGALSGPQGPAGMQPGTPAPGTNPPGASGTPVSTDQSGSGAAQQPIPSGDTPAIMGGNIIGVGGKINKSSIMVYEKAQNYRLFEFIWDPSKDTAGGGQPGMQTGTGLGQPANQTPFGQQPVQNPMNPQPTPQPTPQQPPQNPPQQF